MRNHDPCISCAAHFLDVTVERAVSGAGTESQGPGRGRRGWAANTAETTAPGQAVADEVVASRQTSPVSDRSPNRSTSSAWWDGADLAVVIDAVRSDAEPGTVQLIELGDATDGRPDAGPPGTTSTHGIGLAGVLRLAHAVGSAPATGGGRGDRG